MSMYYNEQVHELFQNAHGPIPYNLMNDYMFRVVLQENELVLRGLIGALLNLDQSEIKSTVITNPIKVGEKIDDKMFVLDIHVLLNDDTHLNLEMQVVNRGNWPERSLSYLCRAYDQLKQGEDYRQSKCAIHIGILDFTPFKECPEFYARNMMMNVKNHHIFSDKFVLNVLDLTQIKLATEEDCLCGLDHWAELFKAKTWEDLRMIAEKNQYMSEAAEEMYARNADETIREQCRVREENLAYERYVKEQLELLEKLQQELVEKDQKLAEKDQKLADVTAERDRAVVERDRALAERNQVISNQ